MQQDKAAKATRVQDQRQADEINRQTMFKDYVEDVKQLLLHENFQQNKEKSLVHIRAQTLTVLQHLDVQRKRDVILYLYENRLIHTEEMSSTILKGANLTGVQFSKSAMGACSLQYLALSDIIGDKMTFDGCLLGSALFEDASLVGARFHACNMFQTQFLNANLTGATFHGNRLQNVLFSRSNLVLSSIQGGIFRNNTLQNVDLYQSDISDRLLNFSSIGPGSRNVVHNSRYPNGSFTSINMSFPFTHWNSEHQVCILSDVAPAFSLFSS